MKKYDWDNYLSFITEVPINPSTLAFFSALPCARPYLNPSSSPSSPPLPLYQPIPFLSRYDKHDNTTDTFFSHAMNTDNTIPRLLSLLRRDILSPTPENVAQQQQAQTPPSDPNNPPSSSPPDQIVFVQLGTGLNGFTDTVHGGVLASLVDEALSTCVEAFRQQLAGEDRAKLYTANLNVSYRAPVMSPGVVVVKTWLRRREGRKWFMEAEVAGEDGEVKTVVKALWISERPKL
ncbi:hypothetical protein FE257_006335 [Aspergillus nanangensis]|uniref:Thioesterase domain-containing protein n=1 Tax=Aspergillus nanangensis TaxID=2582783 RepID=A0AAD4GU21_ASPNN|nr:hypothetical protein FE257_006335 [Aspergillus nanangensis]